MKIVLLEGLNAIQLIPRDGDDVYPRAGDTFDLFDVTGLLFYIHILNPARQLWTFVECFDAQGAPLTSLWLRARYQDQSHLRPPYKPVIYNLAAFLQWSGGLANAPALPPRARLTFQLRTNFPEIIVPHDPTAVTITMVRTLRK